MVSNEYKPEIDGLRAFAIIAVIGFHYFSNIFPGGFIGVDIFFVISGYLITENIIKQNAAGNFSYYVFYARRVRRLFPALAFTIVLCFCAAYLLFNAEHMLRFGKIAVSSIFSVSNFTFRDEAGYFDLSKDFKPLLHTWSLAVEAQFYLIMPFFLIMAQRSLKIRGIIITFLILILANCLMSQMVVAYSPETAFYMFFFRIFEFAIGGLCVFIFTPQIIKNSFFSTLLFIGGITSILLAIFLYNEAMPFPGIAALVPCLGVAAIILSRSKLNFILRNKPMVLLGKISYSLYLIHWPIMIFYKYWKFSSPDTYESLTLIALSLFIAGIMYLFVENPVRYAVKRNNAMASSGLFTGFCFMALIIISTVSLISITSEGMPWRIKHSLKNIMTTDEYKKEENKFCKDYHQNELITCFYNNNSKKNILVWGDSHARHLHPGFVNSFPDHNIMTAYLSSCLPVFSKNGPLIPISAMAIKQFSECVERNEKIKTLIENEQFNLIVLSGRWAGYENFYKHESQYQLQQIFAKETKKIIEELSKSKNIRFLVIGAGPEPGKALNSCMSVPAYFVNSERIKERCINSVKLPSETKKLNKTFSEALANDENVLFISPTDIFCTSENTCKYIYNDNLLFRDENHFTVNGANYLIGSIKNKQKEHMF